MSAPRAAPKAFGATSSNASVARVFVPPATTRAGMAQRAIPTIPLKTYRGIAPNFRCPCGTFCADWPKRVVEREGVIKFPSALGRKASVHAAAFSHFRHLCHVELFAYLRLMGKKCLRIGVVNAGGLGRRLEPASLLFQGGEHFGI